MVAVSDLIQYLERLAPPWLAEEWDNVGLLWGDRSREVSAVMTCLTLTPDVADEAVRQGAGLIVAHHPILFRPVQRITDETPEGRTLLALSEAGVAVYSPHTGYDSAGGGVNQQLAEMLGLQNIGVLRPPTPAEPPAAHAAQLVESAGAGRFGDLSAESRLLEFNRRVKDTLGIEYVQYVGDAELIVRRVAIACGSAAEFLDDARAHGCQLLLTGEARFHACLQARSRGMALVLIGHYASERPAMERMAGAIAEQFPDLSVWASRSETDPLRWD